MGSVWAYEHRCNQEFLQIELNLGATLGPSTGFMPMKRLFVLLFTCMSCHAKVLRDINYVPNGHDLQKLDLHLPKKKGDSTAPVLIAIHGGAWAFGDKTNYSFIQPKTRWFNDKGFIVASINYRLSPAVTHPEHIQDVAKAVAWIEDNISKYGGDPKQLYLLGHSAGAHLAALAAVDVVRMQEAGANPNSIRGVILLDGAAYHVPKQVATVWRKDNLYTKAFTQDAKIQRDASPTLKVTAMKGSPPPFLILHVADRDESKAQSQDFSAAIKAKGGHAQVISVEGKSHATINRDLGKPGDATTRAVNAFLKQVPGNP